MAFSLQSFPIVVANFLTKTLEEEDQSRRASCPGIRLGPSAGNLQYLCLSDLTLVYLYIYIYICLSL